MNDVLDVAHYIVRFYNNQNIEITHLKLQKLLYFVQVLFLLQTGNRCFNNDIVAFEYGPVVREVFEEYTGMGRTPLTYNENIRNLEHQDLIDGICNKFLIYTPGRLVDITHNQRPWRDAFADGYGTIITDASILNYFRR